MNKPPAPTVQEMEATNEDTLSDITDQSIRWLVRDFLQRGYEPVPILAEIQKHYGCSTSVWRSVVDEIEKNCE